MLVILVNSVPFSAPEALESRGLMLKQNKHQIAAQKDNSKGDNGVYVTQLKNQSSHKQRADDITNSFPKTECSQATARAIFFNDGAL